MLDCKPQCQTWWAGDSSVFSDETKVHASQIIAEIIAGEGTRPNQTIHDAFHCVRLSLAPRSHRCSSVVFVGICPEATYSLLVALLDAYEFKDGLGLEPAFKYPLGKHSRW